MGLGQLEYRRDVYCPCCSSAIVSDQYISGIRPRQYAADPDVNNSSEGSVYESYEPHSGLWTFSAACERHAETDAIGLAFQYP